MTNNNNILGKLQTIPFEADPESLRSLQETVRFISFQPYLPRVPLALGRESRVRAPPKSAQPCFDDGRDALHQVRILGPAFPRVLILKGPNLPSELTHACSRSENGGTSRGVCILGVSGNLEKMEATGIQALRYKGFVRPALHLKVDTGPVLRGRIADRVDCLQQRLSVFATVWDITRSICLTAALRLKRDCLSEAVYDQMRAISFHSEMFQVLATNACAPLRR